MSGISDVVTACAALAALGLGYYTFSKQKTSSDIQAVLSIFNRINEYWDKVANNCALKDYYLGQILVYFESACFLANNNIISDQAFRCVSDHIYEVWVKLNESEESRERVDSFVSSPTTYCEIKQFVREYEIKSGKVASWRERVHQGNFIGMQ